MNTYRIVGSIKPDRFKLQDKIKKKTVELPVSALRRMNEAGLIHLENPDLLYHRL